MATAAGEKTSWQDLYREVLQTNLCAGCAACIMACPHNVLDYDHGSYHPVNLEATTAADGCAHGTRGCDICTRVCPRFGDWELEGNQALHGRERRPDEVFGIARGIYLARANQPQVLAAGQDGGLVSALLIWGLQTGRIEGALTSRRSRTRLWDAEPFLATTPAEVVEAAGSRYTYSPNALAMREAEQRGLKRLALVGTGCQVAMNGMLQARRVNKYARRIELTIGLLCSKTFEYAGMRRVIEQHGVPLEDVAKVDIKGRFIVWRRTTGERVDIPLKQLQAMTREGCQLCPDFAASLADLSTGGLGQQDGWTLTIVRTQRGADWLQGAADAGAIAVRPGEEDPAAIALMTKLAAKSRSRGLATQATGAWSAARPQADGRSGPEATGPVVGVKRHETLAGNHRTVAGGKRGGARMASSHHAKREKGPKEPRIAYRQCPGCEYDFVAGTGTKSCGWYDCPYLPEALRVTCPDCNYNFATGEGTPWCADPPDCHWAAEGRRHAENARRFRAQQPG